MSYEGDSQVFDIPQNLSNIVQAPVSYDKSILSRDEVRFNAQSIAFNNTARDITIRMNTAGYVDAATAYLYVDLKVDHTNCQILDDGLLSMIGQATLSIAGKIVERIENVSELLPLLKHSCTQAWLQTEGKMAGQYRYCKTNSYQTSIANDDSVDSNNDSISVSIMDKTAGTDVVLPRAGGTYESTVIGTNSIDKIYVGQTVRHNSMNTTAKGPGTHDFWRDLSEGTNMQNDTARTLCLPLSLIFGLFRQNNTYLPTRNMPMEIKLSLKPYSQCFIHVPPCVSDKLQGRPIPLIVDQTATDHATEPKTTDVIGKIMTDLKSTNFAGYSLTNVHIQTDILTPAPALVAKIDALAAGNTGIQMVIDTYSVNQQPIQYSENINLISTRSYSHLKDVYTTFRPAELETNLFLQKSDRYYGSLVESVSTQIGSKVMPSTNPADSVNEMFINLRKCLGIQNNIGNSRGVVSLNAYQGKPDSAVAGCKKLPYSHGFIPDLKVARATSGSDEGTKFFNAHKLPAQAHSDFVIGTNCQRVLSSSSLSGLNSIGTSYTCTTKVKFKRFNPAGVTDISSSANNSSLDNAWGDVDLLATQVFHSDVLINVSNGLVSVLE